MHLILINYCENYLDDENKFKNYGMGIFKQIDC